MEGKKISFGFMKTKKAVQPVVEEKEYIECVEEKSIKVVGGETVEEKAPLIIPMKPNTLITAERLKEIALKVESALEEPQVKEEPTEVQEKLPENETLDQMAVRELLQDAKKEVKVENTALTVPVPSQPVLDGQKESTLEDYEAVPIQDFGLAMLRGMGWTPGKDTAKYKPPELRPKGLGLGADKVVKANKKDEDLAIVKNAYVKITTGKYRGYYGKKKCMKVLTINSRNEFYDFSLYENDTKVTIIAVISLDEDNGRVMVEITVKKETVSLSEFMMQPVSKAEFDKESKVINADSYEEYKKNEKSQKPSKSVDSPKTKDREAPSSQKPSENDKEYSSSNKKREDNHRTDRENDRQDKSNGKSRDKAERHRRNSSSSEDRSRNRRKDKKHSKRDSSEDKRNHRSRRNDGSSESEDSDSYKKEKRHKDRDIDKKRKGKKKRRDRSRSPHYRKHKK